MVEYDWPPFPSDLMCCFSSFHANSIAPWSSFLVSLVKILKSQCYCLNWMPFIQFDVHFMNKMPCNMPKPIKRCVFPTNEKQNYNHRNVACVRFPALDTGWLQVFPRLTLVACKFFPRLVGCLILVGCKFSRAWHFLVGHKFFRLWLWLHVFPRFA